MPRPKKESSELQVLEPVSNGAEEMVAMQEPYQVLARIEGVSPILFHAWNIESVEEKAAAQKGSKAKKTDDVESYVYRDTEDLICMPGEYVRQSIIGASRYLQDPRSPRRSAVELFKAGIHALTELCPVGPEPSKNWDYLDRRRVKVMGAGITRSRPAFAKGWTVDVMFMCLVPEYISPHLLQETLTKAGRLVGVADFRPTYGRYVVTHFEVMKLETE